MVWISFGCIVVASRLFALPADIGTNLSIGEMNILSSGHRCYLSMLEERVVGYCRFAPASDHHRLEWGDLIQGAGHWMAEEQPLHVNQLLIEFLHRSAAASS
jgi:hypothetical protein